MAIEVVKKDDFKEKARKFWNENKDGIVYTVGALSLAALAVAVASSLADLADSQYDDNYATLTFNFKDKRAYDLFIDYVNAGPFSYTERVSKEV